MHHHLRYALLASLVLVAVAHGDALAVPDQIPLAARLTNNGVPVNGSRIVEVRVFAVNQGGTPQWSEVYPAATVTAGQVYLSLGSQESGLMDAFDGQARFLEIVVEGQVMSPRLPMVSVPYAFRAGTCDEAEHAQEAEHAEYAGGADWSQWANRAGVADSADAVNAGGSFTMANLNVTGNITVNGGISGGSRSFGGIYVIAGGSGACGTPGACIKSNPITGSCTCPAGYASAVFDSVVGCGVHTNSTAGSLAWCFK